MKGIQQQHLQASQSPLMCALAIIIHILSHPIAEGQCLCADFHCPNWCAVVKFSVPHTEGQMGTLSQKGVAVTLVRLCMSPSAMQAANSRYPVVALHHQGWHRERPQADMLSWQFLDRCVITLKVAGCCHHLLVSWSFQPIAWLGFFGGITRIAPELDYTVGSLAMLCHRMHELYLL